MRLPSRFINMTNEEFLAYRDDNPLTATGILTKHGVMSEELFEDFSLLIDRARRLAQIQGVSSGDSEVIEYVPETPIKFKRKEQRG
jgi:hypothetical protein